MKIVFLVGGADKTCFIIAPGKVTFWSTSADWLQARSLSLLSSSPVQRVSATRSSAHSTHRP